MKFSFLKYIMGGAVVVFLLRYIFNEKDVKFWMIVCITIVVMAVIYTLVRVVSFLSKKSRQNRHLL